MQLHNQSPDMHKIRITESIPAAGIRLFLREVTLSQKRPKIVVSKRDAK